MLLYYASMSKGKETGFTKVTVKIHKAFYIKTNIINV